MDKLVEAHIEKAKDNSFRVRLSVCGMEQKCVTEEDAKRAAIRFIRELHDDLATVTRELGKDLPNSVEDAIQFLRLRWGI